jgi:hypothetical protein
MIGIFSVASAGRPDPEPIPEEIVSNRAPRVAALVPAQSDLMACSKMRQTEAVADSREIGFMKDPTGVAALYLGKREGKELRTSAGRHGLVPHGIERNQEATQHRHQSEVQAHQADQEAPSNMGRAVVFC